MKLRTKIILFLGTFFLAVVVAVVAFVEYAVGGAITKQTTDSFRIIAEQSEGAYVAFLEGLKARPLDWTSDPIIQRIAENVLGTPVGSAERVRAAKEFASYVNDKKMPYDPSIIITDMVDNNGIVIASSRADRIGKDEGSKERLYKANRISETVNAKFGDVFFGGIIFDKDEGPDPVITASVRLFVSSAAGQPPRPLNAILLVHFANTDQIAQSIGVGAVGRVGRATSRALLESYKTSDIYFVNHEHTMVTPARFMHDIKSHQDVDTLPVRECLENDKEVSGEYDNYQGAHVVGASMCFNDRGLVLVVEVQKDEIYAPLVALSHLVIIGGIIVLGFGVLVAIFFVRVPLARIDEIVNVMNRVSKGDLNARSNIKTKDEIGYLASMFDSMIVSIRNTEAELKASKREIEEKAIYLEKDLEEHKKQQELMEQSKKATLNILEDSWRLKEKFQIESNRLQTIITSMGTGLVIIDAEYKIILANPRIAEMFAMPIEEIPGKDLRNIVMLWKDKKGEIPFEKWPTEEMFLSKERVVTTLEDELFITTEHRKTQLPVTLSVSPLLGGFPGAVIIIGDATADYELDAAKSGFISVASHQLRTPLTSIRWYSEMLLTGDVGELNEAQRDFMSEVHGGAERLYQTVDLLLGISRAESGKVKSEKEPIDLTKFTADIQKELTSQIDEKNLVFLAQPPEGEPVVVLLDQLMLRQVILNLFSNAIRYTNDNGVIEVTWFKDEAKDEVVYSVRDNGIGIPVAQRTYIFTKFFRAENARATVPDGSGLGLALVKELVELWGGKVWFETEEGKGTTFFFTVPLAVSGS